MQKPTDTLTARLLFALVLAFALALAMAFVQGGSGAAWALADLRSGEFLAGEDASARLPMASTTKTMAALVTLEGGNLDEEVTVSRRAAAFATPAYSNVVGLVAGARGSRGREKALRRGRRALPAGRDRRPRGGARRGGPRGREPERGTRDRVSKETARLGEGRHQAREGRRQGGWAEKVGETALVARTGYREASPLDRVWYTVEGIFE